MVLLSCGGQERSVMTSIGGIKRESYYLLPTDRTDKVCDLWLFVSSRIRVRLEEINMRLLSHHVHITSLHA